MPQAPLLYDQDDADRRRLRASRWSTRCPGRDPRDRRTPRRSHAVSKPTRRERGRCASRSIRERPTPGRPPSEDDGLSSSSCPAVRRCGRRWATAATNPALGPTPGSRLTEWVRDHGGGGIVTWAENTWYTWHAPPKGGKPAAGAIPKPPVGHRPRPCRWRPARPTCPPRRPSCPSCPTPTPGEGQWHPIGRTVDGVPTMYAAYLRPNAVNTSLVTGVAWMDTKLLSATALRRHDHSRAPARPSRNMAPIAGGGPHDPGRRLQLGLPHAGRPGRLLPRRHHRRPARGPARPRWSSTRPAHINIGAWGTDVTMTPSTVAVRQNLDLIVDNGAAGARASTQNDNNRWGATLGGKVQVWRSGIGVTADGAWSTWAGSGPVHRRPGQRPGPGRCGAGHGARHQHRLGELHPLRPRPRGRRPRPPTACGSPTTRTTSPEPLLLARCRATSSPCRSVRTPRPGRAPAQGQLGIGPRP